MRSYFFFFFFSSRRRHTRFDCDWSSDVCSSDLEPVISPALVNLAGALIWAGEFDEGDRWLQRAAHALETDSGPLIRLLLHIGTGMLFAGRQMRHQALAEYSAAEDLQAQLEGSHALARQLTSWRLATQ